MWVQSTQIKLKLSVLTEGSTWRTFNSLRMAEHLLAIIKIRRNNNQSSLHPRKVNKARQLRAIAGCKRQNWRNSNFKLCVTNKAKLGQQARVHSPFASLYLQGIQITLLITITLSQCRRHQYHSRWILVDQLIFNRNQYQTRNWFCSKNLARGGRSLKFSTLEKRLTNETWSGSEVGVPAFALACKKTS